MNTINDLVLFLAWLGIMLGISTLMGMFFSFLVFKILSFFFKDPF